MSAQPNPRFDDMIFTICQETGGIEGLLNTIFSFLYRRTDFFYEADPGDKMGFPPTVNFKIQEHYKKHPKKDVQEYQKKLELYKQAQANQQQQQKQQSAPPKSVAASAATKPAQSIDIETQLGSNVPEIQAPAQQHAEQATVPAVAPETNTQQQKKPVSAPPKDTYNGGQTDFYTWSQGLTEVGVQIEVPEGTSSKDVQIEFTNTRLKVQLKNAQKPIIDGELYYPIKVNDSIWNLEDGRLLTITLEKGSENIWKTVIKGDAEIDATKVDNSKPLHQFDEETQGAIRKIMYEQQRKMMGLPTTDEEKQMELLQKAWNAEGSPFKGQPFDPSRFNLPQQNFSPGSDLE